MKAKAKKIVARRNKYVGQFIVVAPEKGTEMQNEQIAGKVLAFKKRFETRVQAEEAVKEAVGNSVGTHATGPTYRGILFDYAPPHFICQVVSAVRPVPWVSVAVNMENCEKD